MPKRTGQKYVPTADSASNVLSSDVVGNKTDTPAGDSVYSVLQALLLGSNANVLSRDPGAIAQSGLLSLFTVSGVVEIIQIFGFVTTQIQNQPNNTKLVANPSGGPDIDLCSTIDIDNAGPGQQYSITGTFANPMVSSTGAAWEGQGNPVLVGGGTIDMSCSASSTGEISWIVLWRPAAPGGTITAA